MKTFVFLILATAFALGAVWNFKHAYFYNSAAQIVAALFYVITAALCDQEDRK